MIPYFLYVSLIYHNTISVCLLFVNIAEFDEETPQHYLDFIDLTEVCYIDTFTGSTGSRVKPEWGELLTAYYGGEMSANQFLENSQDLSKVKINIKIRF